MPRDTRATDKAWGSMIEESGSTGQGLQPLRCKKGDDMDVSGSMIQTHPSAEPLAGAQVCRFVQAPREVAECGARRRRTKFGSYARRIVRSPPS